MAEISDYGFDKLLNKPIDNASTGVVYDSVDQQNTGSIVQGGNLTLKTLSIGGLVRQVAPGDDINAAIDAVSREGGGTVQLLAKTYTITSNILMRSEVALVGAGVGITIIECAGASHIRAEPIENFYTGGTITSVTSQVNVTGSGTNWLGNISAGQQIFLNNRWHVIAAVTTNTTLILAEKYTGPTIGAGTAYRVITPIQNILFQGFTIQNSTSNNIFCNGCRGLVAIAILVINSVGNQNIYIANSSVVSLQGVISTVAGDAAFRFENCGLISCDNCPATASVDGYVFDTCKTGNFDSCISEGNTTDGVKVTDSSGLSFEIVASQNGSQGIEFISGNSECTVFGSVIKNNTSDGIKLTGTSNSMVISSNILGNNGGYGVNIAAVTDVSNIVSANVFYSNASGQIGDSGTGTKATGNIGAADI